MSAHLKRGFAGASVIGTVIVIALLGWLFLIGVLPLVLFVAFTVINIIVGIFSAKLAMNTDH